MLNLRLATSSFNAIFTSQRELVRMRISVLKARSTSGREDTMDQLIIDECTLETELKSYEDQVTNTAPLLNVLSVRNERA